MVRFLSRAFSVSAMLTLAACVPTAVTSAPTTAVAGGVLLRQDFNGSASWSGLSAAPAAAGVTARAALKPVGTIDVSKSTTPSGAALLTVSGAAKGKWSAALTSGLLPVRNPETNLAKLTLSFDHSVSAVRPVTVRIESFDAKKKRTGGREGIVYPAAPDFYLRSAIELSTMKS
ncbi:MAG: hypothetical protein H7145_01335, partial [Akkermansiaceae bacterium]|nr:hypothetical protein [Armatimonadota bacterium]